jgi:adenine deaminase
LTAVHAKFLAGTDADGYPYLIMGYALLDELDLLCQAGMTPAQALRAATTEPAEAMRVPDAFGRIKRGMRADFVLLDSNPLESPSAYRSNAGVMAHGVWLPRADLDRALDQLARIESEPDTGVEVSARSLAAALAAAQTEIRSGFVFDGVQWTELAAALRETGWIQQAGSFEALVGLPVDGPCAADRPK